MCTIPDEVVTGEAIFRSTGESVVCMDLDSLDTKLVQWRVDFPEGVEIEYKTKPPG